MLIPVLPALKHVLSLSSFQAGLIITLFSIPAGLGIPLVGFLADRFGRRAVLIPALALYAIGGLVAGLSAVLFGQSAYVPVLLGRAIQGFGAAGTAPIAMTLAGDLFGGGARSRALGVLEAANGVGKIVSPILGAALGVLGWFYPFFVFPALVLPVLLAVLFFVPEPPARRRVPSFAEYKSILGAVLRQKGWTLVGIFFTGATALLLLFGLLFFLSEHLEVAFGAKGIVKGLLLAIPVSFMCLTSYLTGWAIKRRLNFMPFVVVSGLLLLAGALFSLIFFDRTLLFFTSVSFAGIGTGLNLPCLNTLVTSSAGPAARGLITALYGGLRFWGVAAGPPLFGLLLSYSRGLAFGIAAFLAALAAVITLFLVRGSVVANPVRRA